MKVYDDKRSLNDKILAGVDKLAKNVSTTMGPRGKNVILQQKGRPPVITKDGVSISRFVDLEDPFENVAVQIIKQAAEKTNSSAGDGTTGTTVLAHAILKQAQQYLAAGVSPIDLKRGIDKAIDFVVGKLVDSAKQITSEEEIVKVATISANGDESIGSLIANAVDKVGRDGSIIIQEGKKYKTTLEILDGVRFAGGFSSSQFITNERKGSLSYDDPYFLVTDHRLDTVQQMLPVLEVVSREGKPLIIMAEELEGQALAVLIANSLRGTMRVASVNIPKFGEEKRILLEDLAVALGATFISRANPDLPLDKVQLKHLGSAKSIDCTKTHTTIVGCKSDPKQLSNRIENIKEEITRTEDLRECERLQERITRLSGGVAIISVGANTEIEMIEKKHRIEDALEAVKSALDEGIIPGGGSVLARISSESRDAIKVDMATHKYGVDIVLKACQEPLKIIVENGGGKPDLVLAKVLDSKKDECYDAVNETIVNAFDVGIIDPVKVIRVSLENAASASGILLTTDHAIVEV